MKKISLKDVKMSLKRDEMRVISGGSSPGAVPHKCCGPNLGGCTGCSYDQYTCGQSWGEYLVPC